MNNKDVVMRIINFTGYSFLMSKFVSHQLLCVYTKDKTIGINSSYLEYLKKIRC